MLVSGCQPQISMSRLVCCGQAKNTTSPRIVFEPFPGLQPRSWAGQWPQRLWLRSRTQRGRKSPKVVDEQAGGATSVVQTTGLQSGSGSLPWKAAQSLRTFPPYPLGVARDRAAFQGRDPDSLRRSVAWNEDGGTTSGGATASAGQIEGTSREQNGSKDAPQTVAAAPAETGRKHSHDGHWKCPACQEINFGGRTSCNRCKKAAPAGQPDGGDATRQVDYKGRAVAVAACRLNLADMHIDTMHSDELGKVSKVASSEVAAAAAEAPVSEVASFEVAAAAAEAPGCPPSTEVGM